MTMRYQPQGLLRLARTPLATAASLVLLPGVNRAYDAVTGRVPANFVGTKKMYGGASVSAGFGAVLGTASTDRITTGLTGAFPAAGRTYYFRARRNGQGGSGLGRLFDKTSGSAGQFLYWRNSADTLTYGYYAGGSERFLALPIGSSTGEDFDVIITHYYSGGISTFNAWVNGQQVITDVTSSGVMADAPTTAVTIGNRADGVRGWDGVIEFVYIADRIISADGAAALYQNRYALYDEPSEDDDLIAGAAAQPNSYTLTAAPGTFSISGAPASMRVTRKLAGGNGSFSLTGNLATLRAGRRVAGATGVITLAGSAVTLRAARRLAAAAGAFTLAGGTAQLVYSPVAEGTTIVTSSGQFVLTGAAVAMRVTRRLQAQPGSFALAGAPASIFVVGGKVDVSTISPARIVVFEGSGSRIVPFGSSGSRVTPFGGSGSRVTPFPGSGSRTVRFE